MAVPITRRLALAMPMLAPISAVRAGGIEARLQELEWRSGGRLGVAVLDTATGRLIGNRVDERFAMCSTCKVLVVALVLSRVDRDAERLDRRITFTQRDLVSPFKATELHVGAGGMTIAELCEAAITVSDSTAANLLFASFGGPAVLTAYLRSLDDRVTELEHVEPALNIVKPGETHDTTSPAAMAATLRRLLLGNALSATSRALLTEWMIEARDAASHRLRVGLPEGWRVANKPGTWEKIATNDIGVIWPTGRAPIVVTAYLGEAPGSVERQETVLAEVARIVAAEVQRH